MLFLRIEVSVALILQIFLETLSTELRCSTGGAEVLIGYSELGLPKQKKLIISKREKRLLVRDGLG